MNVMRLPVSQALRTVAFILMACLVLGVVSVSAQTQKPKRPAATTTKKAASTTSQQSVADAGQRVFIDPATKQIRQPDQADIDALNAASASKAKTLRAAPSKAAVAAVSPSGGKLMAVDDSQMMFSVATKTADGKVVMGCVDDKDKANAVANGEQKLTQGANNER